MRIRLVTCKEGAVHLLNLRMNVRKEIAPAESRHDGHEVGHSPVMSPFLFNFLPQGESPMRDKYPFLEEEVGVPME
jgi:hypothetical protein